MFNKDIENKIHEVDRKIDDLELQEAALEAEIQRMLSEYRVNEEQLSAFTSSKENFSQANWEALQQEKKKIEDKLTEALLSIADPKKSQKNRQSLKDIQRNWLFVR